MSQPQRVTFVLDNLFTPETREMSDAVLGILLTALTEIDVLYLRAHPETPLLYESGVVYQEEPPGAEDWANIPMFLKLGWGDCLPLDTLVLRSDYTLMPMGNLIPGDVIMGDGAPTTVLEAAFTGMKPLLAFDLSNGCVLRCSPEHRLFLHDDTEVHARDVKVGDRLKSPARFACAMEAWQADDRLSDVDLAWLTGVYVADGWHAKNGTRFAISGDDETPKRGKIEQKDRVQAIMLAADIHTRRDKKYVDVHDKSLTAIMTSAGARAPVKKVPSLWLTKPQVQAMLEGLRTDASIASAGGTITHGTVSPVLALQLRVLYRMLGQSVHIRRWDEHGGLGENPIYRVVVRKPVEEHDTKHWQTRAKVEAESVKVRGIRECEPELCCDITTDSGRFYLPESDVIVHNCEEIACWRAAELRVHANINAKAVFTKQEQDDGQMLYHITVLLPDGRTEDPSRQLGMR
jgi:hypothetical protein